MNCKHIQFRGQTQTTKYSHISNYVNIRNDGLYCGGAIWELVHIYTSIIVSILLTIFALLKHLVMTCH